jgi:hypothetical protein
MGWFEGAAFEGAFGCVFRRFGQICFVRLRPVKCGEVGRYLLNMIIVGILAQRFGVSIDSVGLECRPICD